MKKQNILHGRKICESDKRGYPTQKSAMTAKSTAEKLHAKKLYTYKCKSCKNYHLTSQEPRA